MSRLHRAIHAQVLAVSITSVAGAATTVDAPFQGVRHYSRTATVPRPLNIHIADFDLGAAGIHFLVTPHNTSSTINENAGQTTTSAVNTYGASVGINGAFYFTSDPASQTEGNGTSGLLNRGVVASNGNVYSPFEYDSRPWAVFNLLADNTPQFAKRVVPPRPTGGVRPINTNMTPSLSLYNALSGSEQIVTNGVNTAGSSGITYGQPTDALARTGVGITADNHLLMITVDDGIAASQGVTWSELAETMRSYGVINGINFDGGGSTTMAFRQAGGNATVVNTLANSQRAVATHLMAFANPATQVVNAYTYADFLLGDRGTFAQAPTASGSTTGVLATSTNTVINTGALGPRGYVQQLSIKDDPANANAWVVRDLSGAGGSRTQNTPRVATGSIGFWAMTNSTGIDVAIALDETSNASTELSIHQALIPDGAWHLYQWSLADAAQWDLWLGSANGAIDSTDFTIDSIQLFGGNGDALIYLDDISHDALGLLPEPTGVATMLIASALFSRRRNSVD
jgi:hypothetical protein